MTMQLPEPRKPSDLQHPKGTVKAWNGEERKPRSTRWNGEPDYEDPGFATRGGCRVVEGTRPPSGLKYPVASPGGPVEAPPMSRDLEPMQPLYDNLEPSSSPSNEPVADIEKPAVYQRKAFDSSKTSEKPRDEQKSHWRHIFDQGGGD